MVAHSSFAYEICSASIRRLNSPGFPAIQAYGDAVNEIGDRDAEAAADDETASAVKHPNGLDNPDKLQTESHQTVSALPLKNEQHAQNEKAEPEEEHEPGKEQVEQKTGQEKEQNSEQKLEQEKESKSKPGQD